jgi:hypothetical protein
VHMLGTGLTGGGDRSDRCELKLLQLACFSSGLHAFVQGELACVQGELFVVFSSFVLVVCALCLSFVLSRICRAVALA